jgi:hypothetical protein
VGFGFHPGEGSEGSVGLGPGHASGNAERAEARVRRRYNTGFIVWVTVLNKTIQNQKGCAVHDIASGPFQLPSSSLAFPSLLMTAATLVLACYATALGAGSRL